MSKESFKQFARKHPELSSFISNGNTTWQKLYELYDIYGEENSVWAPYFKGDSSSYNITKDTTISDLISSIKDLDLKTVQNGINNIQKAISLLQDFGIGEKKDVFKYEERPMYKYFED